jgi:hypothetical protein
MEDGDTLDTRFRDQFRQALRSNVGIEIRNKENVPSGDLIFQANCFAESKPMQFREKSFATPFGLCRGSRQYSKWGLKNL